MDKAFDSAVGRLARAKHHIDDLERTWSDYIAQSPFKAYEIKDLEPGITRVVFRPSIPIPDSLTWITADILNNLRSALDFACHASTQILGNGNRQNSFPFAKSEAELESAINRQSKRIDARVLDCIRSFKPYKGGDDNLWAMNATRNQNQHAFVEPLPINVNSTELLDYVGAQRPKVMPPRWDRAVGGIVVADIPNGGETKHATLKANVGLAFGQSTNLRGVQVIPYLREMHPKVETIISEIAQETAMACRGNGYL